MLTENQRIAIILKNNLNEIIDYCYSDDVYIEKYKRFSIEIKNELRASYVGCYNPSVSKIILLDNIRTHENNNFIETSIHELAHHVENIKYRRTDHSKEFYDEYRKLLYGAFDLKKINRYSFINNLDPNFIAYTKVKKIVDEYKPRNVKPAIYTIEVSNCFDQKTVVKDNGYKWNGDIKTWSKVVDKINLGPEKKKLKDAGISDDNIKIRDVSEIVLFNKDKLYSKKDIEKSMGLFGALVKGDIDKMSLSRIEANINKGSIDFVAHYSVEDNDALDIKVEAQYRNSDRLFCLKGLCNSGYRMYSIRNSVTHADIMGSALRVSMCTYTYIMHILYEMKKNGEFESYSKDEMNQLIENFNDIFESQVKKVLLKNKYRLSNMYDELLDYTSGIIQGKSY